MATTTKIAIPAFGAHMKAYSARTLARVGRREANSAPFPLMSTEDEVLAFVAEVTKKGFLLIDSEQHKVTISKAEKGGLIIHTEGLPDYKMSVKRAAKGEPGSAIWFTKADYKFFLPSRKVMSEEDTKAAAALYKAAEEAAKAAKAKAEAEKAKPDPAPADKK